MINNFHYQLVNYKSCLVYNGILISQDKYLETTA